MKNLFKVIITIFIIQQVNAQCTVDAGEDLIICGDAWGVNRDSTLISAEIIQSDTSISSILWTSNHWLFSTNDFLDSINILKPKLINANANNLEKVVFKITVTDSLGNSCSDSMQVTFSKFAILPLGPVHIDLGDTTQILTNIGGGIPPLNYTLITNYNTNGYFAWPETTTTYNWHVVDSVGCINTFNSSYIVIVDTPTTVLNLTENKFNIYPNPTNGILHFEFENNLQNVSIKFFDLNGKTVLSKKIQDNLIDLSNISKGIYTFQLFDEKNKLFSYGKIMKE